jgi:hypothetical protein
VPASGSGAHVRRSRPESLEEHPPSKPVPFEGRDHLLLRIMLAPYLSGASFYRLSCFSSLRETDCPISPDLTLTSIPLVSSVGNSVLFSD